MFMGYHGGGGGGVLKKKKKNGYGCAAGNFDYLVYHQIASYSKTTDKQNLQPIL